MKNKDGESAVSAAPHGRRRRIFKIIRISAIVLILVAVLLLCSRDFIVGKVICHVGSRLTGTAVTVEKFRSNLTSGRVTISGLRIANPTGFRNPEALAFRRITFEVSPGSLFSRLIEINLIAVEGMHVNFEPRVETASSNLGEIMDNIERFSSASGETAETAPETSEPAAGEPPAEDEPAGSAAEPPGERKRLVIHRLTIADNTLSFSNHLLGVTVKLPLPELTMTELGGDGNLADTFAEIFGGITEIVAAAAGVDPGAVIKDLGSQIDKAGNRVINVIIDAAGSVVGEDEAPAQPRIK